MLQVNVEQAAHFNQISHHKSLYFAFNRNILCKSRELGAKTLAVCVVSTVQKNFPPDIGAHIALRKSFPYFRLPF